MLRDPSADFGCKSRNPGIASRAMKSSDRFRWIFAILVSLNVAACGPQAPGHTPAANTVPAYGDIMVEGSIGDASNLIPLLASDSTSHGIAVLVFNGLIKYDTNVNIVGDLAES